MASSVVGANRRIGPACALVALAPVPRRPIGTVSFDALSLSELVPSDALNGRLRTLYRLSHCLDECCDLRVRRTWIRWVDRRRRERSLGAPNHRRWPPQ